MSETPRILLHNDKTDDLVRQLCLRFPKADCRSCNSYDELPSMLKSYQPDVVYSVRFAGTLGFPRDALFGTDGPRWLANGGAGTDHYGQWDPQKTIVTNAAGVAADMMAEYVFGGFMHFTLDITGLQADKAAKVWKPRTVVPLLGKTLFVVGLGHTGRAIAARAKAFGMTVLGTRATPCTMDFVDEVHPANALRSILPRADFVAVSTPLTATTRGLIGQEEFDAMSAGVILADVSRGGVVDQTALIQALKVRHVAGAALDVFEQEPLPQNSPFWDLDNAIISPHCSSVYADWNAASFDLFLRNLENWMRGEALFNVVDPMGGY